MPKRRASTRLRIARPRRKDFTLSCVGLMLARYGFQQGTTAVISTDGDFGNVLKGIGKGATLPAPTPAR